MQIRCRSWLVSLHRHMSPVTATTSPHCLQRDLLSKCAAPQNMEVLPKHQKNPCNTSTKSQQELVSRCAAASATASPEGSANVTSLKASLRRTSATFQRHQQLHIWIGRCLLGLAIRSCIAQYQEFVTALLLCDCMGCGATNPIDIGDNAKKLPLLISTSSVRWRRHHCTGR